MNNLISKSVSQNNIYPPTQIHQNNLYTTRDETLLDGLILKVQELYYTTLESPQKDPVMQKKIQKFFYKLNALHKIYLEKKLVAAIPSSSSEDRTKNPLYKSLPPLNSTVEGLLNLEPKVNGFAAVSFRDSLAANWIPTDEDFFKDIGVQLAEKKFDAFCHDISSINSSRIFSIPPIIHLIWMGSPPTPSVQLSIDSWKKYHPNFEIKLWTEKEVKNITWSSSHSKNLYYQGKNWAEKSDALRFEVLYQYGGVYSDTDVVCLNSFHDLMTCGLNFFAGFESNKIKRLGRPLIGSAIIGASKNCPLIKDCINFSQTVEQAPTVVQHLRSGPGPITKASYKALESGQEGVLLLPCSYFYPLPWEKRLLPLDEIIQNVRSESMAIHLWEGSWFDSYHPPKQPIISRL